MPSLTLDAAVGASMDVQGLQHVGIEFCFKHPQSAHILRRLNLGLSWFYGFLFQILSQTVIVSASPSPTTTNFYLSNNIQQFSRVTDLELGNSTPLHHGSEMWGQLWAYETRCICCSILLPNCCLWVRWTNVTSFYQDKSPQRFTYWVNLFISRIVPEIPKWN